MPKAVERLTWDVFDRFIGRKDLNALCVVTDTEAKGFPIYAVPHELEHMDFVPTIIGASREDLIENPLMAERFIPSIIEFGPDEHFDVAVLKLLTGVSGIEIGLRVRHDPAAMEAAHVRVTNFIKQGEIPMSAKFEQAIQRKYQKKA